MLRWDVLRPEITRRRAILLLGMTALLGCRLSQGPVAAASPGTSTRPAQPPPGQGIKPKLQGAPPAAIFDPDKLPRPGTRLTCTVCGDEFDVEAKHPARHYRGKVILFCCERCLPHFDKDPELFVSP